jgi:hypothetical protein
MARKILIAVALIIAVFPYLGFSEAVDVSMSTVLGLLMAAVLLLSRKPKTRGISHDDDSAPKESPQQNIVSHELSIAHAQESMSEHRTPLVHEKEHVASPAPLRPEQSGMYDVHTVRQDPVVRKPKMSKRIQEEKIPEIADGIVLPTRRNRKHNPHVVLAYEEQVHPADVPIPAEVQATMHLEEHA